MRARSTKTILERTVPKTMRTSEKVTATKQDREFSQAIVNIHQNTWHTSLGPLMLRRNHIVLPQLLRQQDLELAHNEHPGGTVMKRRLRESLVTNRQRSRKFPKQCRVYLIVTQPNRPPPMTSHKFPEGRWQALPITLMGPKTNQEMVLVIIDYY